MAFSAACGSVTSLICQACRATRAVLSPLVVCTPHLLHISPRHLATIYIYIIYTIYTTHYLHYLHTIYTL